jgi:glycosyltransferase involved in cell wall biosynthesis
VTTNSPIRVAVVTNILSPYRVPLYERLAMMSDLDLRVILLGSTEANRQWEPALQKNGFHNEVLPGKSWYVWRWEFPIHLNRGLCKALQTHLPDVVMVSGWDQPGYWQSAWWCRRRGVPLVLHNGSTSTSGLRRSKASMLIRQAMVRRASSYVAYGSKAQQYLFELGAPADRVHVGLNTVDVDTFAKSVQAERSQPTFSKRRSSYPPVLLLYVGQLNRRKRVDLLLQAMGSLRTDDIGLLVVGSGPEDENLRTLTESLGLHHIYFEGFQQPAALPSYYALADALVLPSDREVWGLVVNEALSAGLFVITSDEVGASSDTICKGWNGDTFAAGSHLDLVARLQEFISGHERVAGERDCIMADALIRLSIGQSASGFCKAFRQAAHRNNLNG